MSENILIVIVNWNGLEVLDHCIESINLIDYDNYKILIIDNNSNDKSVRNYEKNKNVDIIKLNKNYGFGTAINKSLSLYDNYDYEYLLLINNDIVLDKNILKEFIYNINIYGKENIFGPKIYYYSNPSLIWYAGGKIDLSRLKIKHIGIRQEDNSKFSTSSITDYISGCCMFLSKEIFFILKGFDENFFLYGEDVDFCLRAKKHNINSIYIPQAKIWHHVSFSSGRFSFKKIYHKYFGLFKILFKYNNKQY